MTVEVALGTREGSSVRGGGLAACTTVRCADAATVDKVIDAAVAAVRRRRGVAVSLPSAAGGAGGVVDSAALGEFAEQVTGRNGVLASAARLILGQLGLDTPVSAPEKPTDAELIDLVTAELGSDWPRLVAPVFDGRKAVLFDDRWASAREDLAKLWLLDESEIDADWPRLSERFEGAGTRRRHAGHLVAGQGPGRGSQRPRLAVRRVPRQARRTRQGSLHRRGRGRHRCVRRDPIAASVVAQLLDGGATVIATTSKLDDDRLAFYRTLYRDNARFGATLWVVPANMASYTDIDALVAWVGNEQTESLGPQSIHLKDAQTPTLLFPFAAPRVAGDLSDAGSRAEMEMKVLLWAVQRLDRRAVAHRRRPRHRRTAARRAARLAEPRHVRRRRRLRRVEVRARRRGVALEGRVVVGAASFVGARADRLDQGHRADGPQRRDRRCGRGGRRDDVHDRRDGEHAARPVRHRVQGRGGARAAAGRPDRRAGRGRPRSVRAGRQGTRGDDGRTPAEDDAQDDGTIRAPAVAAARATQAAPPPAWDDLDVDPADLVVIVGGAELGPYGSSRTRFEMEVDNELSAAGVLELAWTTGPGQVGRRSRRRAGTTPRPVSWSTRAELVERYHDAVVERVGIREFVDDGAIDPDHAVAAAGFGVPRQGLHVRGVVGGRCPAVRGVRS